MKQQVWNEDNIKDLTDKVIIVTGANTGLGFEASKIFASKGAFVIMACRNIEKAEDARNRIMIAHKDAKLVIMKLDLSSLNSIKEFVKSYKIRFNKLDILLNNAGVMAIPYSKTDDGFEMQNGINHLGHFALTAQLFDLLKKTKDSRIVNISSGAHKSGKIDFDNYMYENGGYSKFKSYSRSKISNLFFTYELDRRIKAKVYDIKVLAAHPGASNTDLFRGMNGKWYSKPFGYLTDKVIQSAYMGSLPGVRACVDESAQSGEYYGPSGRLEMKGYPVVVESNKLSHDEEHAKKLWDISEKLTGIKFEV